MNAYLFHMHEEIARCTFTIYGTPPQNVLVSLMLPKTFALARSCILVLLDVSANMLSPMPEVTLSRLLTCSCYK